MELSADEQVWLEEFQHALQENYPGLVEDLVVFDAQDSTLQLPDDTVNVVVRVNDKGNRRQLVNDISRLGYRLAVLSDALPLIWVYTSSEWKQRQQSNVFPLEESGESKWSTRP